MSFIIDDPALRRRVLIGLNKGENLHSLARDIAFGRQGRFHDRGYEAQLNRASALSLVINAIAVWNTRYFERAAVALARQGVPVPEHFWQHLSTLQWAHIHLNGSYHFTDITLQESFVLCGSITARTHTCSLALSRERQRLLPLARKRRPCSQFSFPCYQTRTVSHSVPILGQQEVTWPVGRHNRGSAALSPRL